MTPYIPMGYVEMTMLFRNHSERQINEHLLRKVSTSSMMQLVPQAVFIYCLAYLLLLALLVEDYRSHYQ